MGLGTCLLHSSDFLQEGSCSHQLGCSQIALLESIPAVLVSEFQALAHPFVQLMFVSRSEKEAKSYDWAY